jgi:hypothetical protein
MSPGSHRATQPRTHACTHADPRRFVGWTHLRPTNSDMCIYIYDYVGFYGDKPFTKAQRTSSRPGTSSIKTGFRGDRPTIRGNMFSKLDEHSLPIRSEGDLGPGHKTKKILTRGRKTGFKLGLFLDPELKGLNQNINKRYSCGGIRTPPISWPGGLQSVCFALDF